MKKHNFAAGPSIIPEIVKEQTAQGVLNLNNSGLSIMEVSHRSKDFQAIILQPLQATCKVVPLEISICT